MQTRHLVCLCLILLSGAGCLTQPPGQAALVDPGPYPQNYNELILCYLNHYLYEPDSIRNFEILKAPEKAVVDAFNPSIPITEGQLVWEVFVAFDARNRSGKFVGRDFHVVWIRHNKVIALDYKAIDLEYTVKQRFGDPCAPIGEDRDLQ